MEIKYKTIGSEEFVSGVGSRPIMFVGAGVSAAAPSSLPLAGRLVKAFYDALTHDSELAGFVDELSVEELPKDLLDQLGSPELIYNATSEFAADIVPELFRIALESNCPNINHYSLARLLEFGQISRIITTNFDTLIEQCFDAAKLKVDVQIDDGGPGDEGCIWKLHGDLGNRISIAANDVSLIGFSPIPSKLAKVIAQREIVVAGYSGNDFHIVRAFLDGRPEKIWWIVLPDEPPAVLDLLMRSGLDVVVVQGNLAESDEVNPLLALLQRDQAYEIIESIPDKIFAERIDSLQDRLSSVLAPVERTKKAFVLHSLRRRLGIPTNKNYRIQLSKFLHESMLRENIFPDYFSSPPFDVLMLYEQKLTPRLVVRPAIMRRFGLSIKPEDPFGDVDFNESEISKRFSSLDETDILLEFGLEKAYQGGSNLERAQKILKTTYESAKSLEHRALQMRSAEALAWVNFKLGEFKAAEDSHAIFLGEISEIITDLNVIRESFHETQIADLLEGLDPLDEPAHLYKTLAIDRRYRKRLNLLRLAARLRNLGKADLALNLLDQWPAPTSKHSIYIHALEGGYEVERSRCLFFIGEVERGIKLMESAQEHFSKLERWDYEFLRWYSRIMTQYYVKIGQIGKAVGIEINQHVIPSARYERSEDHDS
ncbi:MAG: SIR2 family protein [Anaerolineales bacterium]|nr:SIR2 family protein [Anaerolineales bacterium]